MAAFFWERERSNMKSKFLRLSGILLGTIFFLAIFGISPIVAKASEELYFDNDGNLYYITRERKATSNVKYFTIGWIIKRYDMPIDAPGQQYVIVTKTNYKPDEVDPSDSKYVYCYYRSDKEEILSAIKSVSVEWYNVLNKYGDTVYIDSVMTVIEKGKQKGFLYAGGSYTGEVYFDYKGIAGARDWASPQSLLVNFGMSVEFPVLYKPLATTIETISTEEIKITNSLFSTATNGAYDYDIEKGIPAGEELYVNGNASSGLYELFVDRVTGKMSICVMVPVTYKLKWTDYYGVKQEEIKIVKKYYLVDRYFTYCQYKKIEGKKLVGMELESDLFNKKYTVIAADNGAASIDGGTVKYEGIYGHMLGYDNISVNIPSVELTSSSYLKPTIPDEDYSYYADKMVSQLKVRNDKLMVAGNVIMSDDIRRKETNKPASSFSVDNASLKIEGLVIDKKTLNGEGYVINGKYVYKDAAGNSFRYNVSGLKPVKVHTPVVCNENLQGEKELNQAVKPTMSDVVLGTYMTVSFNDFGTHKSIKGYGVRSYGKYVGKRHIICDFDVEYMGMRYEAGSVIEIAGYFAKLYVCKENEEGIYNVSTRTLAYNMPSLATDNLFENAANLSREKYGAESSMQVRLIGRIEEFNVVCDSTLYVPKDMPVNMLEHSKNADGANYVMEIKTLGDVGEEDYIKAIYNYYVIKGEEIVPVWIYEVKDRNVLSGESLRLVENEEIWNIDNCTLNGNKGTWKKEKKLSSEYIIVKPGTTEEDVKQAIEEKSIQDIVIRSDSLYVAAEFVRYKDEEGFICYINEENAKNGYCNMWLREEGGEELPLGTFLQIGLAEDGYYDYEVSGTH